MLLLLDPHLFPSVSLVRRESGLAQPLITQEMRDLYIQRRKVDFDRMQIAINEKNSDALQHLGHQIKGNAASFQFPELESLATKIEDAGKRRDFSSCAKILDEFRRWLSSI